MALYLGNQKVSLRSGQDPTFDYGFDSNGRLVFANKNATEINNFLNYDSSYSEILDLSNLSKMEKVAVNGTADRKMEGLKGLLVSPNAPFTGSSPQINASYTGLSKSALVSLFESVPYNVGYTKVGNPTIVDGVASGFSSSDYLQILSAPDVSKPFEVFLKITNVTSEALQYPVRFVGTNSVFAINSGSTHRPIFLMRYYGTDEALHSCDTYSSTVSFADNTSYYVRCLCDANGISLSYSTDNTNWTIRTAPLPANFVSWQQPTGVYFSDKDNPFDGSIDLNNTYIKVNGVSWFTGKAAMTKTCSIVGATGTADLTQEDKNIILNKGWSLTVQ